MATSQILIPVVLPPVSDRLRHAVAAYLARFKGQSRVHTESDLRCFVTWCEERGLDPLAAQRPHVELYVRWMQEVRRYKPSTISRRVAVVAGFYRTCVIDEVLVSRVINSLTVWDDGICRHLCWRSAKRTVRP